MKALPLSRLLTGIVDQNMQLVALGEKRCRGGLDALQRVQFHGDDLDLTWLAIGQNDFRNRLPRGHVSHGDEDIGACQMDRFSGLLSEALWGAPRDQDGLAAPGVALVQALVFDDVASCWATIAWALGRLVDFSVGGEAGHDCTI